MSFTDRDPWNHMDVRVFTAEDKLDRARWECESCGADSCRATPPVTPYLAEANGLGALVLSYRNHLRKSHKVLPKCRFTYHGLHCTMDEHDNDTAHELHGTVRGDLVRDYA